jgi:hypothetical protein
MEQLSFHWTDFRKIWNLNIFRKSGDKIKDSQKYDEENKFVEEIKTSI